MNSKEYRRFAGAAVELGGAMGFIKIDIGFTLVISQHRVRSSVPLTVHKLYTTSFPVAVPRFPGSSDTGSITEKGKALKGQLMLW